MAACQDDSDISSEDYTSDEEIMLPEIRALKQAHEKGALHTQQERIIRKMLVSVLKTTKKGYSESGGRVMRLFTFLSFDNF